ncbi:hypothetical protein A2Y83_04815 [Candidatus Falkowbacteria bacterium RBG_13_39_14]|uniref:Antitoxin n=1 Tax=Candidatus Falkowbacteria bacterium RBG_13_39_14 TaxID=1797985 RepID=A0A1F5S1Y3_9BACT|nr:MAG: hypothetical protein A2Y83_04815 [Candidatus Falkowbacteria bacterium RBG_13_39_14]
MIREKTNNLVNISRNTIRKEGGIVILPLSEYEELKRKSVPTYYLTGKDAEEADKLVKEGLKAYKAGKTKVIDSLSDLD